MSEYIIREYTREDIPELTRLWIDVFDEDERMLTAFFGALRHTGSGLAAVMDGKIVGAGYVLTGQSLVSGDRIIPLGLIYGIAVDPRCRSHGIGRAIVKAVAEMAKEQGAEIICCEPANQSLVRWYDEVLSLKPALYRRELSIPAQKSLPCHPLDAVEYARLREKLLRGKNRVRLSDASMGFEEDMLKIYGGGFFAVAEGIAAAYLWEGQAIIRELICPEGLEERCAASLAHTLSASQAKLFESADMGQAYILTDRPIPADSHWNLSFN